MTEVLHRQVPSLVAVEESAAESVAAVVACSVEAFPRFLRKPRTVPHPLLQEDPVLSLEEALPHPHLPLAASIHLQVVANLHFLVVVPLLLVVPHHQRHLQPHPLRWLLLLWLLPLLLPVRVTQRMVGLSMTFQSFLLPLPSLDPQRLSPVVVQVAF